jgi:methionyl-tRNA synthetase
MARKILVTSALPYANGHIHIGHLVEYVQTDIWVRFQKMRGRSCHYFCADDTHGAAIMLRARQEGRSELEFIAEMSEHHQADFRDFGIAFDHYGSTHSDGNRELCAEVWSALVGAGMVQERQVEQLFDTKEGVFLADRFVIGQCPRCGASDQYGDNCEKCGATYAATELRDPKSTLSGTTPEVRSAKHLFVRIEDQHELLAQWTQSGDHLQPDIAKYLQNFFLDKPLRDWDVSRPSPYFGFEIPDSPGNYWYVWFDAPIGYIASTAQWCAQNGKSVDDYWRSEDTEIVHVIGKDIVYFHALFWPAMLKTAGYSLPRRVQVHGFLTVNGAKMSKRAGTQISARTYLDHLDPAALRYYYASKLNGSNDDLDLDLADFTQKVNSDLVGKVVNLASRSARFVADTGLSAEYPDDGGLFEAGRRASAEIQEAYESFNYAKAMRLVMALADGANEYVDRMQPWALKKQPGKERELQDICTVCLNLYRQLVVYLRPVLPTLAQKSAELLKAPVESFADADSPTLGHAIGKFEHLMQRLDPKRVSAIVAASVSSEATSKDEAAAAATPADSGAALEGEPIAAECTIEDFGKVDLRVARVLAVQEVPEARKLLKLTLGLGGGVQRTVFAGIKAAYDPAELEGRLVVMVANLKPRQMKFGLSEGMVLAAGPGGKDVFVLSPDAGAVPGQRIH